MLDEDHLQKNQQLLAAEAALNQNQDPQKRTKEDGECREQEEESEEALLQQTDDAKVGER